MHTPPTASSKATVPSLGMLPPPSKSPRRERGKGPGHHTAAHHAHQPRNLTVLRSGAAATLVPDPQLVSCSPSHCPSSPGLSSSPRLLHSTSDGCESRDHNNNTQGSSSTLKKNKHNSPAFEGHHTMTWKSFMINLRAYQDTDLCRGSVYETRRYPWAPLGCASACRHVSADTRADILHSLHDSTT